MFRNRLTRLSLCGLAGAGMVLALSGCTDGPVPAPAPTSIGTTDAGSPSATAPPSTEPTPAPAPVPVPVPVPVPTPAPAPEPTPTPSPSGTASATEAPASNAPPSATPAPSATDSASATDTPASSAPPVETPAPASPATATLQETTTSSLTIFYVALTDQGKAGPMIGCGDSIVATETGPVIYASQVEASMSGLLENKDTEHGQSGLMNALASSDLKYVSSSVAGDTVTVELTGELSSGGICDNPRIIAQLTYTAMVAAGTGEARILVDGTDINDKLSPK